MGKISFLAGMGAGYILGARAGRQRYAQIKSASNKVWQSKPVQSQVSTVKETAKTKAGPAVSDKVTSAAKATSEKLRSSKITPGGTGESTSTADAYRSASPAAASPGSDAWAQATRSGGGTTNGSASGSDTDPSAQI
ncbi:MAG TPA: protoporphyrinogen oxidase [Dermatophilaceae bacterium]|nr:protoporphyrinogen oxidase [Dermatophilaceae bacterium]